MSSSLIYVENQGGKLAVELFGPEEGPLVVCSPGLGDFRGAYKPLAERLAPLGYRVALIDLRGHGDSSDSFPTYGDLETASDILAVATKLSRGQPVVLAGASMSAAASTIVAGQRPDLVAGIVLLGPVLRNAAGAAIKALLWVLMRTQLVGVPFWKYYAAQLWPGLGPEGAADRAALSAASVTRTARRWAVFRQTIMVDHTVVAAWIGKVKCPALLVMGDKDPDWKAPLAEAEWAAAQFTTPTSLTVEGVGHAPHLEKPEAVSPAVEALLAKLRDGNVFKLPA